MRLALLSLLVSTLATAQPAPREVASPNTVSVTGTARTVLAPDRVVFTAGVQTSAVNVGDAVRENGIRMAAIVAALQKAGVPRADLRTSSLQVEPQQEDGPGRARRIARYLVSNAVTVSRNDPAQAGPLLQVALGAGANQVSGLSFEVSKPESGRDDRLRAAFADAHAKAEVLAAVAGRKLGLAVAITEGADGGPPRPMMMFAARAALAEVPVEAGTQEVSTSISVVFELR